jgi:hypothetical protein
MTMKIHFAAVLTLSTLALSSLGGCAAATDDGIQTSPLDETVAETSNALTITSFFRMRNLDKRRGEKFLGVLAGSPNYGQPLITYHGDGSTNQQWKKGSFITNTSGGSHFVNGIISDPISQTCLDAGTGNNGSAAAIRTCTDTFLQAWKEVFVGNEFTTGLPCYQFKMSTDTSKVLSVFGIDSVGPGDGSAVGIWDNFNDSVGHANQFWCLVQP